MGLVSASPRELAPSGEKAAHLPLALAQFPLARPILPSRPALRPDDAHELEEQLLPRLEFVRAELIEGLKVEVVPRL